MAALGSPARPFGVDLYWLPLGAGGSFVRVNGRIYEVVKAALERRRPRALYHSGIEVIAPEGRFVLEMTPVPDAHGGDRGVVARGPVGARWAGHFRIFQYELRCWRNGVIPDVGEAVDSPRPLASDPEQARRLLEVAPQVPTFVWGRDEAGAGEMWNSNSVVSWILVRAGFDAASLCPPSGGRAPGWGAGVFVAGQAHSARQVVTSGGR